MKVKDRVCDICGRSVYEHATNQYKISLHKRHWETELLWKRLDLCSECYRNLERRIICDMKEKANEVNN